MAVRLGNRTSERKGRRRRRRHTVCASPASSVAHIHNTHTNDWSKPDKSPPLLLLASQFKTNMPAKAMGAQLRIMLYPQHN